MRASSTHPAANAPPPVRLGTVALRAALMLAVLTLLTGVVYPLVVTGLAKVVFPAQAEGSLVEAGGKVRGSRLLGQPFEGPGYFWGRLSATSPSPYNASASSGSNLAPGNEALTKAAAARIDALKAAEPGVTLGAVPADLVTASASGLDPHVSPAAAEFQVRRVAMARGLSEVQVRALVARHTEGRTFGLLGEVRVNVLALNMTLDEERPNKAAPLPSR
ncbi:MAG: potassium-transporting ATPase subunit KdpC [Myxococcales bacterium]|nr:potassium-transporting ATPase subunit KdpC [Myxococcales bacterium]